MARRPSTVTEDDGSIPVDGDPVLATMLASAWRCGWPAPSFPAELGRRCAWPVNLTRTVAALSAPALAHLGTTAGLLWRVFAEPSRRADLLSDLLPDARLVVRRHTGNILVAVAAPADIVVHLTTSAALGLGRRLAADGDAALTLCGGHRCDQPVLAGRRGPRRRWCSTECANRGRVRRHRAAKRGHPPQPASPTPQMD
jgi:hypothetical protein